MNCPECGSGGARATQTKRSGEFIMRRRRCYECGKNFRTYEVEELFVDEHFLNELEKEGATKWLTIT